MKATEFCYWLQGCFEMAKPDYLTRDAMRTVGAHLELVANADPAHDNIFVSWLSMYITAQTGLRTLTVEETDKIKRHLAAQFKHVIDPSYGGDKAELQAVHDGEAPFDPVQIGRPPREDGVIYKC